MNKRQTRQYAMLVQVRDFGNDFKEKFPEGSEGSKAFAVVTAAVAEVDAFSTTKLTAKRVSVTSKLAAKMAVAAHIAAIARSARVLAKATPGADEKFPLPTRKGDIAVLQTGRLFLQEAAPVKDSLIRCGLPPTFLEDLQQSVAGFERAIGVRSAGRAGAAVSRKGIHGSVKIGVDAVGSLDALVLNVLGQDGVAMNRWKRDRHVNMTGKTAPAITSAITSSITSSREQSAAVPVSPAPIPQPTGESTPASSATTLVASSSDTETVDEPLRRAS